MRHRGWLAGECGAIWGRRRGPTCKSSQCLAPLSPSAPSLPLSSSPSLSLQLEDHGLCRRSLCPGWHRVQARSRPLCHGASLGGCPHSRRLDVAPVVNPHAPLPRFSRSAREVCGCRPGMDMSAWVAGLGAQAARGGAQEGAGGGGGGQGGAPPRWAEFRSPSPAGTLGCGARPSDLIVQCSRHCACRAWAFPQAPRRPPRRSVGVEGEKVERSHQTHLPARLRPHCCLSPTQRSLQILHRAPAISQHQQPR